MTKCAVYRRNLALNPKLPRVSPGLREAAGRIHEFYVYLILHFPALRPSRAARDQEVDFLIGKKFIITAHYTPVDLLNKFSKHFESGAIFKEKLAGEHAGFIFFGMLGDLYKMVEHEIELIHEELGRIEESIFSQRHVEMVAAISKSARDLLNVRQSIEPHREVLHELEHEGPAFFGEDFASYLRSLSNDYYRLHNHVMRETESLHELRETNNSLLTTKQNETMKVFTVMALLLFRSPLSPKYSAYGYPLHADHRPDRTTFGSLCI